MLLPLDTLEPLMLDVVDIGHREDMVDVLITEPALSLPTVMIADSTDKRLVFGNIVDNTVEPLRTVGSLMVIAPMVEGSPSPRMLRFLCTRILLGMGLAAPISKLLVDKRGVWALRVFFSSLSFLDFFFFFPPFSTAFPPSLAFSFFFFTSFSLGAFSFKGFEPLIEPVAPVVPSSFRNYAAQLPILASDLTDRMAPIAIESWLAFVFELIGAAGASSPPAVGVPACEYVRGGEGSATKWFCGTRRTWISGVGPMLTGVLRRIPEPNELNRAQEGSWASLRGSGAVTRNEFRFR